MLRKLIVQLLVVTFTASCLGPIPDAHAQTILDLPAPGQMVPISYSFKPLELKGIQVNLKDPLSFDFLVDKGQSHLQGQILKDEITKLSKYFLTCLTIPEKDLWVNLSPYEKNRIAAPEFGVTEMGKSLLEQDYLLKQIMASLSYPENRIGKAFWQKVYKRSQELFGTTDIPIFSFNKVWIIPESAEVYVNGNGAFVTNSQLNVMLETDYNALTHNSSVDTKENNSKASKLYADIMREIILPLLKQEVNQGKNFAVVRQVYTAMILATWYKRHLKDSLLGKMYVGKKKVAGVDVEDKDIKEKIFQQYLKAYKKCVYNYIREDYDPTTQTTVPRKYVSGGMDFAMFGTHGDDIYKESNSREGLYFGNDLAMATVNIQGTKNGNPIYFQDKRLYKSTFPLIVVPEEVANSAAMSVKKNFLSLLAIPILLGFAGSFTKASAQEVNKIKPSLDKTELTAQMPTFVEDFVKANHLAVSSVVIQAGLDEPKVIYEATAQDPETKVYNIHSPRALSDKEPQRVFQRFVYNNFVKQMASKQEGVQKYINVQEEEIGTVQKEIKGLESQKEDVLNVSRLVDGQKVPDLKPETVANVNQQAEALAKKMNWELAGFERSSYFKNSHGEAIPRARVVGDTRPFKVHVFSSKHLSKTEVENAWHQKLYSELKDNLNTDISPLKNRFMQGTALVQNLKSQQEKINQEMAVVKAALEQLPIVAGAPPPPPDQTPGTTVKNNPSSDQTPSVKSSVPPSLGPGNVQSPQQGTPTTQQPKNTTIDTGTPDNTQTTTVLSSPPPPEEDFDLINDFIDPYKSWLLICGSIAGAAGLSALFLKLRSKPQKSNTKVVSAKKNNPQPKDDKLFRVENPRTAVTALQESLVGAQNGGTTSGAKTGSPFFSVRPPPNPVTALQTGEAKILPGTFPTPEVKMPATVAPQVKSKATQGFFATVRSYIRGTDILGALLGAGILASEMAGGVRDLLAIGIAAGVSFVSARLLYAVQLFVHEHGHNFFAFIQSAGNFRSYSLGNILGGYKIKEWLGLLFAKHPSKDAEVDLSFLSKGQRRFNQVFGFVFSLGITTVIGWAFIQFGLPRYMLGALAAGSLKVILGSFREDILKPSVTGKIKCGNSAIIWTGNDDEFFPEFSEEALIKMRTISELRGDQGEGIFTWGETEDGDIVPIIYKIMKTKRGKQVILMTHIGFKKELKAQFQKGIRPVKGVKIVTVHDRFATQGKPTEAALQPHLAPIEKETVVVWQDGKSQIRERTIATVATENGDYNGNERYIKYRTKALSTGEIRELYPQLLHMEKNVFMEPNSANPKGFYDYLEPGDAKALAVVLHWHINQGNPKAASRFAYYDTMTDTIEEKLEYLLSKENEDVLGQAVLGYYTANEQMISWPQLKIPNKDFNSLWVTKEMVDAHPELLQLKAQYEALQAFQRGLLQYFEDQMQQEEHDSGSSDVGALLNDWKTRHPKDFDHRLEKFVNMTIERFCTADTSKATKEVAQEAHDSFLGVTVRHSLQPKHMSILTDDQAISLGFGKNHVLLNSEHRALMEVDEVEEILMLNSEKPGQLTDLTLDEQTGQPIIVAYDFKEKRILREEELAEYRMQLDGNKYAKRNPKRDSNSPAEGDINDIPKTVREASLDWKDEDSFNSQTNGDFFNNQVSRGVEVYIKDNSIYYKSARGQLIEMLYKQAEDCQGGTACTAEEAKLRRAVLVNAVQNDNRVLGYLQSLLDNYIVYEADHFSQQLIAGTVRDYQLVELVSRINQEMPEFLDKKIKEFVDSLIKHNDKYLKEWEAQQKEVEDLKADTQDEWQADDNDRSAGVRKPALAGAGLLELPSIGAGEADMFAGAMGNSLWMAENLKHMMNAVWPGMKIETDSTNKATNLTPEHRFRVGKRTTGYLASKSGATSSSKNSMGRLKRILGDRLFICTGDVDTVMGLRIGQKYYIGADFTKRIFVTGHSYTSEVDSTGDVEMLVNQIEMVIDLAKRWKNIFPNIKLWGFNFSDDMIQQLEERRNHLIQRATALTGVKSDGKTKTGTKEHKEISKEAKVFGHMLKETFSTNILSRIGVYLCGFGLTYLGAKFGLEGVKSYVASALEATIALLLSLGITTLIYRPLTGIAQKWGWLGPKGVVFGDHPVLSQIAAVSARIWGGLALGSMKFSYFAANATDHFAFRHLPDVRPGTVEIFGVPDDPYERGQVLLTAGQSNVRYARLGFVSTWPIIRNIPWLAQWFATSFVGGPEIFTLGHGDVNPDLTHHHMNIGPVEHFDAPEDASKEQKEAIERMNKFWGLSFETFDRLVAYHVFLKEAYEQARHLSKWQLFIQGTISRVKIFNTPSPVGSPRSDLRVYADEDVTFGESKTEEGAPFKGKKIKTVEPPPSAAMTPEKSGGIDMNSQLMELNIKGKDTLGTINFDDVDRAIKSVEGFVPQVKAIITVSPNMLQVMLAQQPI